ncbi:MAG TPA: hypothetical protein VF187_00710 [Gemmatimonadales bacterium]
MRRPVFVAWALAAAACGRERAPVARGSAAEIVVKDAGFATPESVLHDPLTDMYLVSNINGGEVDADDNGFISLMTPEGKVAVLRWIDGASDSVTLNAPKGMAVIGGYLYVADINTIRRFDRRTGGPRGAFPVRGASFLNDLAPGPDGSVYFTDTGIKPGAGGFEPSGTDAVYRLGPDGRIEVLAKGDSLGHPNGIALSGDSLWVVSYGSGELYRIADGQRTAVRKLPKGGLDGLVLFQGDAFISSWDGEVVYRGPIAGPFREAVKGLPAPADIGHDMWRNRLLIPLFNANEIRIVPLAL